MTTTNDVLPMSAFMDFTTPSGHVFTIREQNGADDDILSNEKDSKDLMNISKFIAAIVTKTNFTENGKLTVEDALRLPANDRYTILINSRIFSIGETIEFQHSWGDNREPVIYEQDLRELIFDYSQAPSEEELEQKKFAIPYYTTEDITDIEFTIPSGKVLKVDLLTGETETEYMLLPESKRSRNTSLTCRNLQLLVEGNKWVKVTNFSMFSVKDMVDIHKFVKGVDPLFTGNVEIEDPVTGNRAITNILGQPNFFYMGGI